MKVYYDNSDRDWYNWFDQSFAGAQLISIGEGSICPSVLQTAVTGSGTQWDVDKGRYVECTGWLRGNDKIADWYYAQTIDGRFVLLNYNAKSISECGWSLYKRRTYTASAAQKLIDKLISNNKRILENNLLCAYYSNRLSSQQKRDVVTLQRRLEARNDSLKEDGYVSNLITSQPPGYKELLPYLTSLENSVGSTTATIIVSCVVIAALATAAYFFYKNLYEESEDDVKYSDELTKTLMSKLTPEEYEQLKKETAGLITKAKIKQKFASFGSGAKVMLIAAAVVVLWPQIRKNFKE